MKNILMAPILLAGLFVSSNALGLSTLLQIVLVGPDLGQQAQVISSRRVGESVFISAMTPSVYEEYSADYTIGVLCDQKQITIMLDTLSKPTQRYYSMYRFSEGRWKEVLTNSEYTAIPKTLQSTDMVHQQQYDFACNLPKVVVE